MKKEFSPCVTAVMKSICMFQYGNSIKHFLINKLAAVYSVYNLVKAKLKVVYKASQKKKKKGCIYWIFALANTQKYLLNESESDADNSRYYLN